MQCVAVSVHVCVYTRFNVCMGCVLQNYMCVCVCHALCVANALGVADVYLFVVDCVDCCVALPGASAEYPQHSSVELHISFTFRTRNNEQQPLPND